MPAHPKSDKDLSDIEELYLWKRGPNSHGLKAQWFKKKKTTKQRKGEQYTVFSAYLRILRGRNSEDVAKTVLK